MTPVGVATNAIPCCNFDTGPVVSNDVRNGFSEATVLPQRAVCCQSRPARSSPTHVRFRRIENAVSGMERWTVSLAPHCGDGLRQVSARTDPGHLALGLTRFPTAAVRARPLQFVPTSHSVDWREGRS